MSDLHELAKRAVACKGWRWMPGMAWTWAMSNNRKDTGRVSDFFDTVPGDACPRLSDPATLGCLLALVRETWGRPFWVEGDTRSMGERPDEWIGVLFEGRFATCPVVHASTEAEALVAALEAAP